MRGVWLALAFGLAIGGCQTAGNGTAVASKPVPGTPIKLSAAQIKAVHEGARAGLKDPDSARFGEIAAAERESRITVCGFVNAKNSYGGYTGMKPFIGVLRTNPLGFDPVGFGSTSIRDDAIAETCREFGVAL